MSLRLVADTEQKPCSLHTTWRFFFFFFAFLFWSTFSLLDDRMTDTPGGYKNKLNIKVPLVKTWTYSGRYGQNNKIGDRIRSCWKPHMRNSRGMPRRTHYAWEPLISRTASCEAPRRQTHVGRKTSAKAVKHEKWPLARFVSHGSSVECSAGLMAGRTGRLRPWPEHLT